MGGKITDYLDILGSRERVLSIISDELTTVRDEFSTPRRTEIIEDEFEVDDEDLIPSEEMVVTVSHLLHQTVPLSTYRRKSGKGRSGMSPRIRILSPVWQTPTNLCCSSLQQEWFKNESLAFASW